MALFKSEQPPMDPHVEELTTILMEELFECLLHIGIRTSKAKRFGLAEVQPGQQLTNAQRLAQEVGDLNYVVAMLLDEGVLDEDFIQGGFENKAKQLAVYLQTQAKAKEAKGA